LPRKFVGKAISVGLTTKEKPKAREPALIGVFSRSELEKGGHDLHCSSSYKGLTGVAQLLTAIS
jgi:hypothetical protein